MKCPKCAYVGYEQSDRCRHCGYEFSLVSSPVASAERIGPERGSWPALPDELIRDEAHETPWLDPLGPSDLQGFEDASAPSADDLPLRSRPAAGLFPEPAPPPAPPPLAVRRAASDRPRSRTGAQVIRRAPAGLLDGASEDEAAPEATGPAALLPAAVPLRLLAGAVDLGLLAAIDLAVVYLTVRLAGLSMDELALVPIAPLSAFLVCLSVAYLAVFTACGGQTLGKMAFGLQVVSADGAVPPGRAIARVVMGLIGGAVAGVGYLPALLGTDRQALHDRLTDTRVVRVVG